MTATTTPLPEAATPAWSAQEWRVFGTGARMVLPTGADLGAARAAVDRELAAIDLAAGRFRADSEISRLDGATGRPFGVSELFAELIEVALQAAADTDGAVDPTLGSELRQLGYDCTFSEIRPDGPALRVTMRRRAGWRAVQLDRPGRTVQLPAGMALDLGATAKAHAADRAAAAAHRATGSPVLLGLGGDIAMAGPPPAGGWAIAVAEDSNAGLGDGGPVVVLHGGGVATSSTTVRRWRRGGETVHHLLDPRTGRSASGHWRTVSVAAGTCLEANIAATATIVTGEPGANWLTGRRLPARLVTGGGAVRALGGWPEENE